MSIIGFINAETGSPVSPGAAFARIYSVQGKSNEVLAAAERLDAAIFLTNDEAEAHDAADFLDIGSAGLGLASSGV